MATPVVTRLVARCAAALVALGLLACQPVSTPAPSPLPTPTEAIAEATTPPTASPAPPVARGEAAPDFSFTLFQGEDVLGSPSLPLSQLRGTPVVLNFWARYCTPCWTEMPELQEFYEGFGARVHLVGVDVGQFTGLGSPKDAAGLLESLGITYPVGFTDDATVVGDYGIWAMPTTVFIDAAGRVFRIWTGALDLSQLTQLTEAMLGDEVELRPDRARSGGASRGSGTALATP